MRETIHFEEKHFVYKTVNKINGREYIGVHTTYQLNDGYLGSGKLLQRAIKKYGRQNFSRIIIQQFSTREEAFQKEKEIVSAEYLRSENTYNLNIGGFGATMNDECPTKENYQTPTYCKDFDISLEFCIDEKRFIGFKNRLNCEPEGSADNLTAIRRIGVRMFLDDITSICETITNYWNDQRFHDYSTRCLYLLYQMGFGEFMRAKRIG